MICNNILTQYAYIVDNIIDNVDITKHMKICVKNYLENNELHNDIINQKKYIKCRNNHLLYVKHPISIQSHFVHTNLNNVKYDWYNAVANLYEETEIMTECILKLNNTKLRKLLLIFIYLYIFLLLLFIWYNVIIKV